jgi:hypothetical protein
MKRFLTWTAAIIGVSVAGTFAIRAIQAGRQRVKHALGEAEAVADHARAALEQTETALRTARQAI